jgi:nicotinic acid mononucleotide adenylyltransferase
MVKAAVNESDWIEACPWESSRATFINFTEVTSYIAWYLKNNVPKLGKFRILYVCGADLALKCGLTEHASSCFTNYVPSGVAVVGRPGSSLKRATIMEGCYVVDAKLQDLSSTDLRKHMMEGKSLEAFTFPAVIEYMKANNISVKEIEEWMY